MEELKTFLCRMCEVENITVKELQELTGKSKSVVYKWLKYSDSNSFPSYDSLSKILCRLGLTMDEFLRCKSDKIVNYEKYRTYKHYFYSYHERVIISHRVVEALDCENILNCFIFDMLKFKKMLSAYLNGETIDLEKFDVLCLNLQPYFSTEIEIDEFGGGTYYYLDSSNLADYKYRCERYNELLEEDPEEALKMIEEKAGLKIYNLGTGQGYSVLDMVKNFEAATGVKVPYVIKERRPGDIDANYADATKAKEELGWEAKYGIKEMCADAWRWQSQNPNGYDD